MCGIVGYLGISTVQADNMFQDMLQMDVVRGPDSTGIAAISKRGAIVLKGTELPTELIHTKRWQEIITNASNYCMIGHNRWATKGEVNEKNAHPFQSGRITLVHNGTLSGQWRLPEHLKYQTDSENICYAINKLGIEEAWPLIDGAATIVWWDSLDMTLNMASDGKRPMTYAYLDGKKGMLFSSESWTLRAAAYRNNAKILSTDGQQTYVLKDNLQYKFKFDKKAEAVTVEQIPLKEFRSPVYNYSYRKHDTVWKYGGSHSRSVDNDVPILIAKDDNSTGGGAGPNLPLSLPPWRQPETEKSSVLRKPNSNEPKESIPSYSNDTLSKGFKIKKPDEKVFHDTYKNCCHCGTSLQYEYDISEIIDDRHAMCAECLYTANKYGIAV